MKKSRMLASNRTTAARMSRAATAERQWPAAAQNASQTAAATAATSDQAGQESREITLGERFRAQHDERHCAQGGHQGAEMAEDNHGEPGQKERCRDAGPHPQSAAAGAGLDDVRQRPVPQVRVRVLPGKAVDGGLHQGVAFFREGLAAGPGLRDGVLQRGQRGGIRLAPVAAQRPEAGPGAAQFIAAGFDVLR